MSAGLPPCPPQLKLVQHYLKLASDYESRNSAISYWARLFALQTALKIDRASPEAKALLGALMGWLENFKKENLQNDSITSDIAAQAIIENEAHKLFTRADSEDRAAHFNKNTVKIFYTAGILFDICEVFGELNEDIITQRKYAKWKATYIHNCLKSGETPVPGPIGGDDEGLGFDFPAAHNEEPGKISNIEDPNASSTLGFSLPPINQPENPQLPSMPTNVATTTPSLPPSAQQYGYVPQEPPRTQASGKVEIKTEHMFKAQKYCKYAISGLDYEDVSTAIDNLKKALAILTTGRDA